MRDKGIGATVGLGILIILVILGFSGYTYYQESKAMNNIEAGVIGSGVPDVSLTSIDIPFEIKFHNPSSYDSPPFTGVYEIYVSGQKIGEENIPKIEVSAGETETVSQSVTVEYADLGEALVNTLEGGSFKMTVEGKIKAKMVFGQISDSRSFENSYTF